MQGRIFTTTDYDGMTSWLAAGSRISENLLRKDTDIRVLYADARLGVASGTSNRSVDAKFERGDHVNLSGGKQQLEHDIGAMGVDYILGKRALEYIPDIIGWFLDLRSVCSHATVLAFYISDSRFGLTECPEPSSIGDVAAAWLEGRSRPSTSHVFDAYLYQRHDAQTSIPDDREQSGYDVQWDRVADAFSRAQRSANGEHVDGGCWVFSPSSFLHVLDGISRLGLFPFKVDELILTEIDAGSFFIVLTPEADRDASLRSINAARSRLSWDPREVLYRESENSDRIRMHQWFQMASARLERLRSEISRNAQLRRALDDALEKNERLEFELRRVTRA